VGRGVIPKRIQSWFVSGGGTPQEYRPIRQWFHRMLTLNSYKAGKAYSDLSTGFSAAEKIQIGKELRGETQLVNQMAKRYRQIIDAYSKSYIKLGIPTKTMEEVIEKNIGMYLPRVLRAKILPSGWKQAYGLSSRTKMDLN